MMKIALSTNGFLPHATGGVEVLTLGLAQMYQMMGHSVDILCAEPDPTQGVNDVEIVADSYAGLPVSRVRLNPAHNFEAIQWTRYNPQLEPVLSGFFQQKRPDVVHALTFGLLSSAVVTAAKTTGAKVLYTASNYELTCSLAELIRPDGSICDGQASFDRCLACRRPRTPQSELVYHTTRWLPETQLLSVIDVWHARGGKTITVWEIARLLKKREVIFQAILDQTDRFVAPSAWSKEVLIKNGVLAERVSVIHHGVQPHVIRHQPKSLSDCLRFGFIGRITEIKGVHLLINAFRRLPEDFHATLTISGPVTSQDQAYAQKCRALADGDPRIQFTGPLTRQKIPDTFAVIDVLVVPSLWHEVYGIVIQEAFANQTPVIAAKIGGIPELVQHDKNGLLYPAFNEEALFDSLYRCCANPMLVARLQQGIPAARTVEMEANELLALYLMDNHRHDS